jgi:phosphodiesterase/alkaline phosphatase D-like protein
MFDFITQTGIKNVIFLSADVHYAAVLNHQEGFKEIIVGPIAQLPSQDRVKGRPETEFSSNQGNNYGLVRVHANQTPASVEITILGERNVVWHTTTVEER